MSLNKYINKIDRLEFTVTNGCTLVEIYTV